MKSSKMSQVRQNYSEECENALNAQINMELFASHTYLSMATFMDRDDVAMPGFHKFFMEASHEEREHAMKLMKYQNKRGGRVILKEIRAPIRMTDEETTLSTLETALKLERDVNDSLMKLHTLGEKNEDGNLCDFIEEFLQEQVDSIKKLGDHITNLKRVGPGLGLFIFDKHLND